MLIVDETSEDDVDCVLLLEGESDELEDDVDCALVLKIRVSEEDAG